MPDQSLNILIIESIKPGREKIIEEIMKTRLIPALRKQLPEFRWKIYRPVLGAMSKIILLAPISAQNLVRYDEWINAALAKEHGAAESTRYLEQWWECVDSIDYMGVVEDPAMSNM